MDNQEIFAEIIQMACNVRDEFFPDSQKQLPHVALCINYEKNNSTIFVQDRKSGLEHNLDVELNNLFGKDNSKDKAASFLIKTLTGEFNQDENYIFSCPLPYLKNKPHKLEPVEA